MSLEDGIIDIFIKGEPPNVQLVLIVGQGYENFHSRLKSHKAHYKNDHKKSLCTRTYIQDFWGVVSEDMERDIFISR